MNDIKVHLKEIGCVNMNLIPVANDNDQGLAIVNMVMKVRVS
jgi:hypothetical protein